MMRRPAAHIHESLRRAIEAAVGACFLGSVLMLPAAAGAQTAVTCGQTFSGSGILTGSCVGTIVIQNGTLDLDGHTLSGAGLEAIKCEGACTVVGPGTVNSVGSQFGILGDARVRVFEVTVTGHGTAGVQTGDVGGLRLENSTITGNGIGVKSTRIKITASTIDDNAGTGVVSVARGVKITGGTSVSNNGGHGIETDISAEDANRAVISDSMVNGNDDFGVIAKNVKGKRSTFNVNGLGGVSADFTSPDPNRAQLIDCQVIGNGETGVTGGGVKVKRSTIAFNGKDGVSTQLFDEDERNQANITDCTIALNGEFGIYAKRIKTRLSVVQKNGVDAACGDTTPCADLASVEEPRFSGGSVCDTSLMLPQVFFVPPPPFADSWGLCLDD